MDHEQDAKDLTPASWLRFGQRNILYIGFVVLLLPLGLALDGPRPPGARTPGGMGFALLLCGLVSAAFFLLNAGLLVVDMTKGRHVAKTLTGCALPLIFGAGAMLLRALFW